MGVSKKQKIRIKLKSYDTSLITTSCQQIINTISKTDAKVVGPIPLPTQRKIYCVLRSPHVDKDSREHLEIRTHSRIIEHIVLYLLKL